MKTIKKYLNEDNLTRILYIYIILQPIFDILSYLYIRNYINIGISTISKPAIVFAIGFIIFIKYKKYRMRYIIFYGLYGLLMVIHSILLNNLQVELSVILHELRFMINILYMLILFTIFHSLYKESNNKDFFVKTIKKAIIITFAIYIGTFFLSIITGTSAKTYEYSDPLKQGFKGWLDSGQIFGHSLCILLPFIMHILLNNKSSNKIIKILLKISIILPIGTLLLIGTKVTYFIALIVLLSHFTLYFIFSIKEKNKNYLVNSILSLLILIASISLYNYLPVKNNIDINKAVLSTKPIIVEEEIDEKESEIENQNENKTIYNNEVEKYKKWDLILSQSIQEKYKSGELHPADSRKTQLIYNFEKFKLCDLKYKIFGLGYLNQNNSLSIERDFFMMLFNFGLLGFALVLIYPICLWLKSTIIIFKNLKKINLETLYLYEGFSMFFFISIYAGYTFIYTNFSIFLVLLMILLIDNINNLTEKKHSLSKYFDKIFNEPRNVFENLLEKNLKENKKTFIVTANPETIMIAEQNHEFQNAILENSTLIIPDGIGIVEGSKMLGYNIKETIPGIEICSKLFELCNIEKKSIFLFGARKKILEKLVNKIHTDYSNINLIGYENGYVENKQDVFDKIASLKPDVVLIALGIPEQELLIYNNLDKFDKGIFVGVGGSFDVLSGNKKRAPKIFRKLHLEWLYRITTEPKRLKRFFTSNITYIFKLKNEKKKV